MAMLKRSQSIFEYGILIASIVAGLVAMQVYVQRSIQGRLRDLSKQISPQQYSPEFTDSQYTILQAEREEVHKTGRATHTSSRSLLRREGNETSILEYEEIN